MRRTFLSLDSSPPLWKGLKSENPLSSVSGSSTLALFLLLAAFSMVVSLTGIVTISSWYSGLTSISDSLSSATGAAATRLARPLRAVAGVLMTGGVEVDALGAGVTEERRVVRLLGGCGE